MEKMVDVIIYVLDFKIEIKFIFIFFFIDLNYI